jgi:hypothetical protein
MPGTELIEKWYFYHFRIMTMTKGIYYHGLTRFQGFVNTKDILEIMVIFFK